MKIMTKNSPKEIYELKIQSVSEKDIKKILKEILLEKARYIFISPSDDFAEGR